MEKHFLSKYQNFYGLVSLIENPLTLETKLELSRLLYLNPKVSAEEARTISNTYRYDFFALRLLSRMREQVQNADNKLIYTSICDNLHLWIKTNGLLTLSEIVNLKFDPLITPNSYLRMVKNILLKEKELDLNLWNKFLGFYHSVLPEDEINELLDAYLMNA
jgi:hypothetical protein